MISIIHPSKGRPEMAYATAEKWLRATKKPSELQYILSIDSNEDLDAYRGLISLSDVVLIGPNKTAIQAINNAAKVADGNLLIVVSDDFDCFDGWDEWLLEKLQGKEDFVVKTADGIQERLITLPIMDRKYYNRFGYIYYPEYQHMFCDTEMTDVGHLLNRVIDLRDPDHVFKHLHYTAGYMEKDAINKKNDDTWTAGELLYNERKAKGFNLNDALLKWEKLGKEIDDTLDSMGEKDWRKMAEEHSTNSGYSIDRWTLPMKTAPKLSILICTMESRKQMFDELVDFLIKTTQDAYKTDVEILSDCSGGLIGTKRNALLEKAQGEFVVFIDDDDVVEPDYINKILTCIIRNPDVDCIGISGIITTNGADQRQWHISKDYGKWYEENSIYYRTPSHISPVRRTLALEAKFPDTNWSEDAAYSEKLLPLLKTEAKVIGNIYHYKAIAK